jgi:hypothetical protein
VLAVPGSPGTGILLAEGAEPLDPDNPDLDALIERVCRDYLLLCPAEAAEAHGLQPTLPGWEAESSASTLPPVGWSSHSGSGALELPGDPETPDRFREAATTASGYATARVSLAPERFRDAMEFTGPWHIFEMEVWDESYFNMEVQAHLTIEPNGLGSFQFGLVTGGIDGKVVHDRGRPRFEFTWEGNDENDPACGSGWVRFKAKKPDELEGEFRIHLGDDSTFQARRARTE